MNIFIIIAILVANLIAIALLYQFVKSLDKKEKLLFIAITVAINYMIVSAIYFLSSIGIDKNVAQSAKAFVTYMFVPVNIILVMPFLASTYIKAKAGAIKRIPLKNRIIVIAVWAILIMILEFFYFRNIQVNISSFNLIK